MNGPFTAHELNWRRIDELLDSDQYELLARYLEQAQTGQSSESALLAAARQTCLICHQSEAEVEWHQRAYREASQRQDQLRYHLQQILDLLRGEMASEVPESPARPPIAAPAEAAEISAQLSDRKVEALTSPYTAKAEVSLETLPVDESGEAPPGPTLVVHCLGLFRVYQDDQPVEEWASSKGKSIFKYLIAHRDRPVAKEVLMDLFWPEASPDAARNNLNVAVYSLRQTFRRLRSELSYVLFQDDCYVFSPDLQIWVDVEEFTKRFKSAQAVERQGDLASAIHDYHAASALYQGEFLEEDRYEEWLLPRRQQLQETYLHILNRLSDYYLQQEDYDSCAIMCGKMLTVDPCREEVYRRLMRCYSRQGQRYLALRQYHLCAEALGRELDAAPSRSTIELYEQIQQGESL